MSAVSRVLHSALEFLLPPLTVEGEPSMTGGLGAASWGKITFLSEPVCDGCSLPFAYEAGLGRCAACLAHPRSFDRARAACLYDEHSREPVLQLKHGDRTDLVPLLSRWIVRASGELISEADVIVPVPMTGFRLLRRRYNQAAELARRVAAYSELAYDPGLLRRRRDTGTQGGRSASGRRRNVQGAFVATPRARAAFAGKTVLLIDDVMTTGATAEACARALKAGGVARVHLAVICRVAELPVHPDISS